MRAVLLVEGSKALRRAIADVLTRHRFNVLQAESEVDALETLEACPHRVDLCILSADLTGTDAVDLATRIRAEREGIKVVFFGSRLIDLFEGFIAEPLRPQEFVEAATTLLERRATDRRGPQITFGDDLVRERRRRDRRAPLMVGATALETAFVQEGDFLTW